MNDQRNTTTADDPDSSDAAKREGQRVKGTASDAASNVGDTAAERGREIKGEAKRHASGLLDEARGKLHGHADEETRRAGSALSTAGTQLQALADGNVDEAGVLGDYVEQVADYVNHWADTIQDRGLDGLLDDVRTYGRRKPGMFLVGALAAGLAVGRFGRNVAPVLKNGDSKSDGDNDRQLSSSTGRSSETSRDTSDAHDHNDTSDAHDDNESTVSFDRTEQSGRHDWTVETDRSDSAASSGSGDDDLIVGHATDDSDVVNPGDDVEYRSIDADQGRAR